MAEVFVLSQYDRIRINDLTIKIHNLTDEIASILNFPPPTVVTEEPRPETNMVAAKPMVGMNG